MQLALEISPSNFVCLNKRSGEEKAVPATSVDEGGAQSAQDEQTRAHQQLLLAAGQGSEQAFAEIVGFYQQPLYAFVVNMLGNASGAEDVTQEVFLRVWKAAPRWKPKASVRSFLFLIARRVVYNEFRRRKRKPQQSLEQMQEENPVTAEKWQQDEQQSQADEQLSKQEFWQAIDQALANLPSKQRAVLLLRRDGELSYEEIAQSLQMSVSSVKSQLWRARQRLKQELEGFEGF